MQWTIRYFLYKADHWENLAAAQNEGGNMALGPAAYAARKAAMWRWLALKANKCFVEVHPNLQLLV
jgi:hypothetical protein